MPARLPGLQPNRMLAETLEKSDNAMPFVSHGLHTYGGGYTEYVERTGWKAPGLRSQEVRKRRRSGGALRLFVRRLA